MASKAKTEIPRLMEEIKKIAASNRGLVLTKHLNALGMDSLQIYIMVEGKLIVRLKRGAYMVPGMPYDEKYVAGYNYKKPETGMYLQEGYNPATAG